MIPHNALVNLVGHVAPLAAAIFLVPALVARLDEDRFGFLTLAWILIGYFSLFDLGFARALSRLIAERRSTAAPAWLHGLSRTAITVTLLLGAAAGMVLFLLADYICERLLRMPQALQAEAADALRVLACSVPLVSVTAVLRGLLEAGYRFGWVNALRIPMGILLFAAPLVAAMWRADLVALAIALALVRAIAFAAHWLVCLRFYGDLIGIGRPRRFALREMLGYGAWVTVSNVVGPVLLYLDRFALGAFVAVSAVAYYAMPYEIVTRLWIIPAALAGVMFPVMAAAGEDHLNRLYRLGSKAIVITVFPVALALVVFAPDWLRLWLGEDYATRGALVAQLLCFGVMVNCLAYVPATLVQAKGRADLIAKMHLAELPLFLLLLATFIPAWQAEGAALATATRCIVDAAIAFVLARKTAPHLRSQLTARQILIMVFVMAALAGAMAGHSLAGRVLYFCVSLAVFVALAWFVLLDASERSRARRPLELITGEQRHT